MMKRRSFMSLLGAAGLAPALPAGVGSASAAAGYNRYMYGLAVFHARTRASLTVGDLMARLKVSAGTAEAMMGEMATKGVIAPVVQAAGGAMRTLEPHHRSAGDALTKVLRKASDWLDDDTAKAQGTGERSASDHDPETGTGDYHG